MTVRTFNAKIVCLSEKSFYNVRGYLLLNLSEEEFKRTVFNLLKECGLIYAILTKEQWEDISLIQDIKLVEVEF